jgi:DNA primase
VLWDELEDLSGPNAFSIATIWDRLARYGDLFAPVLRGGQTLHGAMEALGM